MSQLIEVKVPDIGDYKAVPVIEVMVKPGDVIEKEQSIVTLESDKATMDVPSSHSGVVKEVKVKVGDTISEGTIVVLLEENGNAIAPPIPATQATQAAPVVPAVSASSAKAPAVEPPVKLAPPPPPVSNIPAPTSENMGHASPCLLYTSPSPRD